MKHKTTTLLLFLALLLAKLSFTGCGPDVEPPPTAIEPQDTFYANDTFLRYWHFPKGSWWVYQRTDTAATLYDTATVIGYRKEILYYPEESPYAFEACGMGIFHSTKLYGDSIQGMSNAMFEENTVGTSGFISGTGVFFTWPIWYDDISVKVLDTLPYNYQDTLLNNCVHTKRGDEEFWLVRDIGVVKYKWVNGHVWELVNHKIK